MIVIFFVNFADDSLSKSLSESLFEASESLSEVSKRSKGAWLKPLRGLSGGGGESLS